MFLPDNNIWKTFASAVNLHLLIIIWSEKTERSDSETWVGPKHTLVNITLFTPLQVRKLISYI